MLYSGWDEGGEFFYAMEILYGGIPGRPIGDGMDGHSWWPLFENIPTEYLEAYYPLRIDGYTTVADSGGAGLHRGGNGVEKRYVYLEPGEVSIHDDRWLTRPWGVLGGEPGERSTKLLRRADGTEQVLPAKCDEIAVQPGDMLIYRTAGGGGWKDRLDRPAEAVARDVAFGLVSREGRGPGTGSCSTTPGRSTRRPPRPSARASGRRAATRGVRLRAVARGHARALRGETGLPAPQPATAAAVVAGGVARGGARARRARRGRPTDGAAGVGGRPPASAGPRGSRAGPPCSWSTSSTASPTRPRRSARDLDAVVAAAGAVIDAARAAGARSCSRRSATTRRRARGARSSCARSRRSPRCGPGSRRSRSTRGSGASEDDPLLVKAFASAFFGTPLSALLARRL